MSFNKYISIILHPIVMPTIGVMLYFLVVPNHFLKQQKFTVLSFVFVTTYLIPLFMIFFLKRINVIKSYKIENINERKLPVALMIILFYFLAKSIDNITFLRDLSLLFYATSLGLTILFILIYYNFKISIHLYSLGVPVGFFLTLTNVYGQSYLLIIIVLIFLSGVLASSRLKLNAHTNFEVYSGFFLGIISVFITNLFYSI